MKTTTIKDMMVPLSQYGTVSQEATLAQAVVALDAAQAAFDPKRYRHRALLVSDPAGHIVGKVSQLDILRALEPKYRLMEKKDQISRLGFSVEFLQCIRDQYNLFEKPMEHICQKAAQQKIKEFMQRPTAGEYIAENDSLDIAIHRLIMGQHQSLLVTCDDRVVGILRLTDVYQEISQAVKACKLLP